jgi:cytochrome c-type biogenesis protein
MDLESWQAALDQSGPMALALGFATGFVFSFNTVAIAAIPVVLAYVTPAGSPRRALALAAAFVLGLVVTHVLLGVGAALGGEWVHGLLGREWGLVLGPLLIVVGLIWAGWLPVTRLPWFSMRARPVSGAWGAFALGMPFSVAICPVCTPALVVMLAAAAASASVWFGFALLGAFALGRAVPIVLGAWAIGWLESLAMLARWQRVLEVAGGLILLASGAYLINEYFFLM